MPRTSTHSARLHDKSVRKRALRFEPLEDRQMLSADIGVNVVAPMDFLRSENAGDANIATDAAIAPITDGRLAYHSYTDYGIDGELHVWDFALAAAYTRAEQTVNARVRYVMNPQFSGDGRYLVMMGVDRQLPKAWPNLDVLAYDFQTNTVTNLSEALVTGGFFTRSQDWIDEDPSFIPTTLSVVLKRRNSGSGQSDLWSMQLNTATLAPTTLSQLTNTPSVEESGPKFSPDGQTIVCWVNGGTSAWIGTLTATGGPITLLADNAGIQDYYPSYWDSTRVLYTSWDNASSRDDDIRIHDLANSTDTFAAASFHSAGEDSDAFRISSTLVGFSSTTGSADGKWRLRYGDPLTGMTQVLPFHTTNKHDLGGTYTTNRVGYAAALPGDYSSNGVVDAADYVVWRNALGTAVTNYSGADGDGSGVVDQGDYAAWRSNFDSSLSPDAAQASTTSSSPVVEAPKTSTLSTTTSASTFVRRAPRMFISNYSVLWRYVDLALALPHASTNTRLSFQQPQVLSLANVHTSHNDKSLSLKALDFAFDQLIAATI